MFKFTKIRRGDSLFARFVGFKSLVSRDIEAGEAVARGILVPLVGGVDEYDRVESFRRLTRLVRKSLIVFSATLAA